MFSVKLEGGLELEAALLEMKTATAKSLVRRVLKRSAQPLANRVSELAPEAKGDLKESYVVTSRLNRRQASAERREGRDDVFMYVGTNDPAGVQQEFGNRIHAAQPHFRPAWDEDKEAMLGRIIDDMGSEVEKAAARARRKAARL